jgi:hypothetical protein
MNRAQKSLGVFCLRVAASVLAVVIAVLAISPVAAHAAFGVAGFDGSASDQEGNAVTQAGAHPYEVSTKIDFNTVEISGTAHPEGQPKQLTVKLPAGLIGDPGAVGTCTDQRLAKGFEGECSGASQIGVINLLIPQGNFSFLQQEPIYNMVPPKGTPAQFGFTIFGAVVHLTPAVRSGDDYGLNIESLEISQGIPVNSNEVIFWGVPADPSHDAERNCAGVHGCSSGLNPAPFLRMPTSCSAPQTTFLLVDSWLEPAIFHSASFVSHDRFGQPVGVTGCESLEFQPTISAQPTSSAAESPTGLTVHLRVPQNANPNGLASSDLKGAVVRLPEGMAINSSSATGLGSCSAGQIALSSPEPATCPDNSKVGTVQIDSPLVDHPLEGNVYLAKQGENKFGSMLAVYIAIADRQSGVVLKIPGKIETSASGRIVTTFPENPQLPFEELTLQFFEGPRAPLVNPPACGSYTVESELTPWSGGSSVASSDSFAITSGPGGSACGNSSFAPKLSAGTADPIAGNGSPLQFRVSREDGSPWLGSIKASLPYGLLGKLKGIPYCPDADLAAIPSSEGSAAVQIASPVCPASQVGTVTVAAGAGTSPFRLDTGRAYLAGPYKGAPLSLAFVTPVSAGPLDLGNVVVRAALEIDPVTAQITVVSDSLPTVLYGIPLDLREILIKANRPEFTINPTSCEPMAFSGTATAITGASAPLSDRFQVGECASLGLKPKLALKFSGAPTRRGGHPKLTATLTTGKNEANLKRVQVTLPKTEYLENAHIKTVCTRVQYAANQCPQKSIYGFAKAWTPLLDKPLEGPVYLRSSSHKLPDLVASLDGQIHIDLAGRISSSHSRIRNTFETVPDAPVSKFVLTMQGGGKGLLVNNTNLCKAKPRATVEFDGQNGKLYDANPLVQVGGCGKGAKKGNKKK